MTERDFCFWLQGHFELSETLNLTMSAHQVQLINNHLCLVEATEQVGPFTGWLRGFLDRGSTKIEQLDADATARMRNRLKDHFLHVIDPAETTDPKLQQQLNEIHQGHLPPGSHGPGGLVMRC